MIRTVSYRSIFQNIPKANCVVLHGRRWEYVLEWKKADGLVMTRLPNIQRNTEAV